MALRSHTRLTALEQDVLALLYGKRLHGLAIMEMFKEIIGDRLTPGSLYPLLKKMEAKGWLAGEWSMDSGQARRRYYTATAKGVNAVKAADQRRQQLARGKKE
jgi:DNA-binding PadR family transcriptional regulator